MVKPNGKTAKKENIYWFIAKQVLGFILTILLFPVIVLGGCMFGPLQWSGGGNSLGWNLIVLLSIAWFYIWYKNTRNYGVRLALILLTLVLLFSVFL